MSIFNRGSDGLASLRDAASALKRWRPAGQSKLQIAREHIERFGDPPRPPPEDRRPGGRPGELADAADPGTDDEFAVRRVVHPRPGGGRGTVHGAIPKQTRPPAGASPFFDHQRKKEEEEERLFRKLERLFPGLRWLFRRLDRSALAGRPWLLGARRTVLKHRRKLIWIFVVGASLMMSSS